MENIDVYTDGACKPNPGRGGWGWHYTIKNILFEDYGGNPKTTNNIMEMTAFLEFFKYAPTGKYTIYSDSKYCIDTMVSNENNTLIKPGVYYGWMKSWIHNKNTDKKNAELWREMDIEIQKCLLKGSKFTILWIKGHSENPGNDRADMLANKGIPN